MATAFVRSNEDGSLSILVDNMWASSLAETFGRTIYAYSPRFIIVTETLLWRHSPLGKGSQNNDTNKNKTVWYQRGLYCPFSFQ